jgi:zinc protease
LGIDYIDRRNGLIEAVTRDDIARVARRLLRPENMIVVIVGKPNLSPDPGLPEDDEMRPAAPGHPGDMPF